jgi:HSP20 family protein
MADVMRFRDPLKGISSLQRQMDDMFDNLMSRNWPMALGNMPTMDVYANGDKELVAEVHAPGFTKDNIEVNINEGVLEILPRHANADKVDANFENGILKVIVPFKELPKPKKVDIKSGNK